MNDPFFTLRHDTASLRDPSKPRPLPSTGLWLLGWEELGHPPLLSLFPKDADFDNFEDSASLGPTANMQQNPRPPRGNAPSRSSVHSTGYSYECPLTSPSMGWTQD